MRFVSLIASAGLGLGGLLSTQPLHAQTPLPKPAVCVQPTAEQPVVVDLINPAFDLPVAHWFEHWVSVEHASAGNYSFALDTKEPYSKPNSARIRQEQPEDFGTLQQMVEVKKCWYNKKARFSGMLRAEGLTGQGGGLILQAFDGGGSILLWNHMDDSRIKGSQPWKRYNVEIQIPPTAYFLRVGFMLQDDGSLWGDDMKLEIVE